MEDRINHEQNFKNLILDYPRDALTFFAPDRAPLAEETVEIMPINQEAMQQRLGEHYRELNVPLLVQRASGHHEAILFALHEEADWRFTSITRLLRYYLVVSEQQNMNNLAPVMIFLRDAEDAPIEFTLGTEIHRTLEFECLACKLKAIPFERWQDSDNLVARLNLPNMQCTIEQMVDVYALALKGLLQLEPDRDKQRKCVDFVNTYAQLTDDELQRFQEQYPEVNEAVAEFL